MVEKLYGVEHGKSLELAGIRVADFDAKPGIELTKELISLPANTSVGIEHAPELEMTFKMDNSSITTGVNSNYWIKIKNICESKNLNIVYLEDFPTYKKFAGKLMEKNNADEENLKNYADFHIKNPFKTTKEYEEDPEVRKIIRKSYKASVEAEYIFAIEREQKIFDKIAKYQPQIVILGKAHSDYAMLKPRELSSRKIPLGKYFIEERYTTPWFEDSKEFSDETTYLIENPSPNKNELLDRELIKRRYRAATEGRIMTGKIPDFVGTWDITIPARGLFEIYLNKKDNLVGLIEDTLGTATFNGSITDKKAIFAKNYNQKKSSSDAIRDTIMYAGNGSNDLYIGDFKVASGYAADRQMPFVMKKYSKSSGLNLV
jgi:hypothetical protein